MVAICRAYHNITGLDGTFAKKVFKQNLIVIKENSIVTAIYIKLCNVYKKTNKRKSEYWASCESLKQLTTN